MNLLAERKPLQCSCVDEFDEVLVDEMSTNLFFFFFSNTVNLTPGVRWGEGSFTVSLCLPGGTPNTHCTLKSFHKGGRLSVYSAYTVAAYALQ